MFDNDGTLWCEKPMYIQLDFIVRRLAEKAAGGRVAGRAAAVQGGGRRRPAVVRRRRSPSTIRATTPTSKVLAGAVLSLHASMTVEEHAARVSAFFAEAKHPTLGRPYQRAPMRRWSNCCGTWKPTASPATSSPAAAGTSCVRSPARIYGIPPERVVGSSQDLRFEGNDGTATC